MVGEVTMCSPVHLIFEHVWPGDVEEKNWALSTDQYWLQAL